MEQKLVFKEESTFRGVPMGPAIVMDDDETTILQRPFGRDWVYLPEAQAEAKKLGIPLVQR